MTDKFMSREELSEWLAIPIRWLADNAHQVQDLQEHVTDLVEGGWGAVPSLGF